MRFGLFVLSVAVVSLVGCYSPGQSGQGVEWEPPPAEPKPEQFSPEGAPQCELPETWDCPATLPWDESAPLYRVQRWWDGETLTTISGTSEDSLGELIFDACLQDPSAETYEDQKPYWIAYRYRNPDDNGVRGPSQRERFDFDDDIGEIVKTVIKCAPSMQWAHRRIRLLTFDPYERLSVDEWPQYAHTFE